MPRKHDGFAVPRRSADFRAGHRRAVRACVAWLHRQAADMNDPRAKAILDAAAFQLGTTAAQKRRGCICPTHGDMRPGCPIHGKAFAGVMAPGSS